MNRKRITILVADDHPIYRRGLCEIISATEDLRVVGEASTGDEALSRILELRPTVAILDISMPNRSGLEVARDAARRQATTRIVLLTMHDESDLFDAAIDAGVLGYVLKDNAVDDVVRAIRAAAQGDTFISPAVSGHLVRRGQQKTQLRRDRPGLDLLTPTEQRILAAIAGDRTSKEIADDLNISVRTVETHRQNISKKLNLTGAHSLVKFAFQHKSNL